MTSAGVRRGAIVAAASVAALSSWSLAACSSSDAAPPRDAGKPTVELCAASTGEAYYADLAHASKDGAVHVHIVDAAPAPPQQGANAWIVRVTGRDDRPLHGKAIAVDAFVPSRGYGSARAPKVTRDAADDSVFHVDGLFLELPGVWQITVRVLDPAEDARDAAAPPPDAAPSDASDDAADDAAPPDASTGDDAAPSTGDASTGDAAGSNAAPGEAVSFSFCVAS